MKNNKVIVLIGLILVAFIVVGLMINYRQIPRPNEQTVVQQNPVTATFKVNEEEYTVKTATNASVLNLMQNLSASSIKPFSFSGQEYAGLGFFVDEINGVKNDASANKYWLYYINGESATVGISEYIVKPNDIIQWKYEISNF